MGKKWRTFSSLVWWCVHLLYTWRGVNSAAVLECNPQQYCFSDQVQCQCTVSTSDSTTLHWRVYNETVLVATETYGDLDLIEASSPLKDAPELSIDLSSISPSIISNISFTVQSSINGYTIQCSDNIGNNTNYTIIAQGLLSFPEVINATISNKTTIHLSWIPLTLNSQCVAKYTVNSNTTNSTITTTDTSVTIPLDGLSAGVYCVSVAAVDTANRTGEYSEEECFELNVPPTPIMTLIQNLNTDNSIIRIRLTFPGLLVLPVTNVFVMLSPNNTMSEVKVEETGDNIFTIEVIRKGNILHNITAFGANVVGNGSTNTTQIILMTDPDSTISMSSTSTSSLNSTRTSSVSPSLIPTLSFTPQQSPAVSNSVIPIIVPACVIVLLIVLVVPVLGVSIRYCCCKKPKNIMERSSSVQTSNDYELGQLEGESGENVQEQNEKNPGSGNLKEPSEGVVAYVVNSASYVVNGASYVVHGASYVVNGAYNAASHTVSGAYKWMTKSNDDENNENSTETRQQTKDDDKTEQLTN